MREKIAIPIIAVLFIILSILALLFSIKAGLAVFGGGILLAIVFFKPFWGLLLYLAMLYLRPQEFVGALQGQPIMLALALLVLGTFFVHNAIEKKRLAVLDLRQGLFLIAFFAAIVLSQLQRLYLTGAKNAFSEFLPVFMLFFMIIGLTGSFEQLKKAFLLLFGMTLFLAANGILQHVRGYDIAGMTDFEGRIRWIGIFNDPNDLGLTILAFTPFALIRLFRREASSRGRIVWAGSLAVFLYAMFLTDSRGTFVGLLAVLTFFLARHWGLVRGLATGALLAAAVIAVGPGRMSEMSMDEASASGRIEAWSTGINLLIWRPILGVGFGNFTEHHILTAHNSVVLCMAELGLVGLFLWLLLIVTCFHEAFIAEKHGEGTEYALYAETLEAGMIGFFTAAFFLSRTYNEVLYILLGLCTVLSYLAQRSFGYRIKFMTLNTAFRVGAIELGLIAFIKVLVVLG